MKKFIKALICLFLVAVVSVSVVGCKKGDPNNPKPETSGKLNALHINEKGDFVGGRHIREKGTTNYDFITNSRTDYVGVLPAGCGADVLGAFSEFNFFLKDATGLTMAKQNDNETQAGQKFISFGQTQQLAAAMVAGDVVVPGWKIVDGKFAADPEEARPLKGNGFVIKTVGENIFVVGGQDVGNVFGAYHLLHLLFNYTQYSVDIHYIDKDVKNLKLPALNYLEDPDITERMANWGAIYYNQTGAHRLGYRLQYAEILVSDYHTAERVFLPAAKYSEEHPEWYNAGQTQLCYTAHGNKESYDLMVATVAANMWEMLKQEPNKNNITFTQQDISTWCTCDDANPHDELEACKTTIADYNGAQMSTQFFFANDLCKKIEEYRAAEQPNRPAIIVHIFAYHLTIAAPVEPEKVNGKWVGADGSRGQAVGHPNLSIFMAIYGTQNYQVPLDDPDNIGAKNVIDQYTEIANHVSFWPYTSYFDNYIVPLDSFTANQNHYKYYALANAELLFNQGQHNNNAATGFSHLKMFMFGKWGWDVNLDYNTLVDEYFERVFGKKDGAMRQMYEEIRTYNAWRKAQGITGKSIYGSGVGPNTFPTQMLFQWMNYVEQARKEIAHVKDSDYELWEKMDLAITLESLMPRYFLAKYHINLFPMEERAEFRRQFKLDCTKTGLNRENEGTLLESAIDTW